MNALFAASLLAGTSGCALSHEIGDSAEDDGAGDDRSDADRDAGPRDSGPRDLGRAPFDGGPIPDGRDLGPRERSDAGPGDLPADPEDFEDEVDRYVRIERRAREDWCPCQWMTVGFASEEECLETMFYPRDCFDDAVAGSPKNEDLAALRCFNDAADRIYFPCIERIDDCSADMECGVEFGPAMEECIGGVDLEMCFQFGGVP